MPGYNLFSINSIVSISYGDERMSTPGYVQAPLRANISFGILEVFILSRLTPAGVQTAWPWEHNRCQSVREFKSISIKKQMKCCSFWKAPALVYWTIHARQLQRVRQFIFPRAFGMELRIPTVNYCCFGLSHHRDSKRFFAR